jgi:hypothetical protein
MSLGSEGTLLYLREGINISGIRDERNTKECRIFLPTNLTCAIGGYIPSSLIPFYQVVFCPDLFSHNLLLRRLDFLPKDVSNSCNSYSAV